MTKTKNVRVWTLTYESSFDNHPPVVTDGPDIAPGEQEVKVIALDDILPALRALEKSKQEWETIMPNGHVHFVAWQEAREALKPFREILEGK